MFQHNYAEKIFKYYLRLLNAVRVGEYLPDRVTNLSLQYLTSRFLSLIVSSLYYWYLGLL